MAEMSDKGVLFLIDEAHLLNEDELRRFGKAYQVSEARVPDKMFAVVVAGLPYLTELMGDEYNSTFLARMEEIEVGLLTDREVKAGIRDALEKTDRRITNDALALAVRESGGWPHVMQTVGYFAVKEASTKTTITLAHVEAVLSDVHEEAGKALLRTMWRQLPHNVRWMLALLADSLDEVIDKSNIKPATGLSNSAFSNTLTRTLETGFVTKISNKEIIFPLPFARPWVRTAARRDNLVGFDDVFGQDDEGDVREATTSGRSSKAPPHPLFDEAHVRSIAAKQLDAKSRTIGKAQRCLHRGPRTKKRCTRPKGHNGQHRY